MTGERIVSQLRRPRKDLHRGLALFKALDPGGVEGGRRGGQQRLLNGWGEAAIVALSQDLLTKIVKCHLPLWVPGGATCCWCGCVAMATTGVLLPGRAPGYGDLEAPQAGSQVCPRFSTPQVFASGSLGPSAVLHPCSAHTGGLFLAQDFLIYMLLSLWRPPDLELRFEGITCIHKVVQVTTV